MIRRHAIREFTYSQAVAFSLRCGRRSAARLAAAGYPGTADAIDLAEAGHGVDALALFAALRHRGDGDADGRITYGFHSVEHTVGLIAAGGFSANRRYLCEHVAESGERSGDDADLQWRDIADIFELDGTEKSTWLALVRDWGSSARELIETCPKLIEVR